MRIRPLDEGRVRIRDAGARLIPGTGCEPVDDHEVVCRFPILEAELGDGDDRFVSPDQSIAPPVEVHAGRGDDRVQAHGTLDGGGGRDVLIGSSGSDDLMDGDSPRAPDADLMDGGRGIDRVSYHTRRHAVTVDLRRNGRGGEQHEGDLLRDLESANGGAGDDRIFGGLPGARVPRYPVWLSGGPGNDVIVGTTGRDVIHAGEGADSVDGRGARDEIDLMEAIDMQDTVRCGPGRDSVDDPQLRDFLSPACERPLLRAGGLRYTWLHAQAPPGQPVLGTTAFCFPGPCRWELRVVAARSRRPGAPPSGTLLGRRTIVTQRGRTRRLALRLNAEGRRAVHRTGRVSVVIEVHAGGDGPTSRVGFRTELRPYR